MWLFYRGCIGYFYFCFFWCSGFCEWGVYGFCCRWWVWVLFLRLWGCFGVVRSRSWITFAFYSCFWEIGWWGVYCLVWFGCFILWGMYWLWCDWIWIVGLWWLDFLWCVMFFCYYLWVLWLFCIFFCLLEKFLLRVILLFCCCMLWCICCYSWCILLVLFFLIICNCLW